MNFLEKHWWLILAIIGLWWLANNAPTTTSIGNAVTGAVGGVAGSISNAVESATGTSSDTDQPNFWVEFGAGAAILALVLL